MKVLVTGGTGFVGRHLVHSLVKKGEFVRMLVRKTSNIEEFNKLGVELIHGDIIDGNSLQGIVKDINIVYHLAAEGHVSAVSDEAYKRFVSVNVEGTKNLIKECSKYSIKMFVHFSSTAAMGLIKKKLVDEHDQPQPVTPYQKSKLSSEKVALSLGKELRVSIVVIRPCMIYGVNGKGEFFKMFQLMRKGFFPRVGFGRNLTPLIHVKDVVHGAIKAAENGISGEVYLIASEHSIALTELRNLVMEAWGTKAIYPYVPFFLMYSVAWSLELLARLTGKEPIVTRRNIASTVWDREFSIEKAKRELGYSPQVSFRDGIIETVEWFKTLK